MAAIAAQLGAFGQVVSARQRTSSYPNISFSCSLEDRAHAAEQIAQLLLKNDPLQLLADWSLSVADAVAEPPARSVTFSPNLDALGEYMPRGLLSEYEQIL
jgi:hypothetical protein